MKTENVIPSNLYSEYIYTSKSFINSDSNIQNNSEKNISGNETNNTITTTKNEELSSNMFINILRSHYTERDLRFCCIVLGIFMFFGCHNYMQEMIMSLPGYRVSLQYDVTLLYYL